MRASSATIRAGPPSLAVQAVQVAVEQLGTKDTSELVDRATARLVREEDYSTGRPSGSDEPNPDYLYRGSFRFVLMF